MGCAQSRIENEEAVSRCKDRKQHMKDAVTARNAFAAAHSSYAMALKNTGAALSDFAHGESSAPNTTSLPSSSSASAFAAVAAAAAAASSIQAPMETPLPPPPPLPDFSPSPLQRAVSMPDLPTKKFSSKPHSDPTIREEEDDEDDGEHDHDLDHDHDHDRDHELDQEPKTPPPPPQHSPEPLPPMPESTWDYFFASMHENMAGASLAQHDEIRPEVDEQRFAKPSASNATPSIPHNVASGDGEEPPVTPEKLVLDPQVLKPVRKQKQGVTPHHQHAASASAVEARRGKMVAAPKSSISLLQVLNELDDHFLKASQGAHEVSKMLEANRMHYHSNFADNRGELKPFSLGFLLVYKLLFSKVCVLTVCWVSVEP